MNKTTYEMIQRLQALGLTYDEATALRRASMTLSRWAELECGDGNDFASWAIERDDQVGWRLDSKDHAEDPTHVPTDKPYMVTYPHNGKPYGVAIPDREKGALRRVAAICAAHGLYWYHQSDPRGAALYVSREPLTDSDYPKGVAVYK